MKNNNLKMIVLPIALGVLFFGQIAFASEFLGNLSTGGSISNILTGTVESPQVSTTTPVVEHRNGGGFIGVVSNGTGMPSASFQPLDFDQNGKIDVVDFAVLMAKWGKTKSGNSTYDISDFVALMVNWTK